MMRRPPVAIGDRKVKLIPIIERHWLDNRVRVRGIAVQVGVAITLTAVLYGSSLVSYLLFHSLVEIVTIAVAMNLFLLAWNTQLYLRYDYLKILGVSYGFIGLIDLMHTLAFKGMGVFPSNDANLATQLWIAARYLQAFALCSAPLFARRTLSNRVLLPVVLALVGATMGWIFSGTFPTCYLEGTGLTSFKIVSEYVISGFFLVAVFLLSRERKAFTPRVFSLIVASIGLTILSELAFTSYISVYSQANLVGHLLKLMAFVLIYQALVEVGFKEPYEGIFRDLRESERTLGETVLERTARLRESEERFRSVFESSPLGKALTAPDGRLKEINQSFADMLGYAIEELQQRNFGEFTHPDDQEISRSTIRDLLAGEGTSRRFEKRFLHRDGHVVWAEVTTALLRDHQGTPLHFITSVTDITGRKQNEAERERLQAQLNQAQKMEAVGLLAGGVAHDFNNMLGVILGRVQIAQRMIGPDHPVSVQLVEIQKAGDRSVELTRQLLAFARKQTIVPRVLDFNRSLEKSLSLLERLIGEAIEIVWLPGKDLLPIRMDPGQIDQVLANLCVNARDAINGTGTITVETRAFEVDQTFCRTNGESHPGPYVVVAVSDNGHGMSPETRARIFEPFFTTKELGQGTGLGLATVYGIVKQNNGFITVYSEEGKGTTFQLYFPALVEPVVASDEVPVLAPLPRGHETILLVEDEPMLLDVVSSMLNDLGFNVLSASTPEEALRLAEETTRPVDLLVTDVIMPHMNGKDLATRLCDRNPRLKVIFMSGYTAKVIAQQDNSDSAEGFLQKPFTTRQFAEKIAEVLSASSEAAGTRPVSLGLDLANNGTN